MGTMLEFIADSAAPVTEWRLTYAARITSYTLADHLAYLEKYHLIKRVRSNETKRGPRQYGQIGATSHTTLRCITITPKGRRFLELVREMAALMPKAPWILENE